MHAFIFDFDGVIVNSEWYWDTLALETYRTMIPDFTSDDDKDLKGRSLQDIYERLQHRFSPPLSSQEFKEHLRTITDKVYGELCEPLPGLRALVTFLQEHGTPMGIASSGERPWIQQALKRLDLSSFFTPIVTAADVGVGKPNPAVYLEAARQMNQDPTQCIAIEDSTHGLHAAKAAGLYCIGLRHAQGIIQDLSEADLQISTLEELTPSTLLACGF